MKSCLIFRVEYRGPTDTTGARILVKSVSSNSRAKVVPWNHALDASDNYEYAVKDTLEKQYNNAWKIECRCGVANGQYYVCTMIEK